MTKLDPTAVEKACVDVVSAVIDDYRPQLLGAALAGKQHELRNERHQDNFLSDFDLALHNVYKEALADRLRSFVYLSEEAEPEIVGSDPDLVILVDPLDTSELAVRGLHGYTHLLAYSLTDQRPVVAVVGDFYHEINLYVGSTTQPTYLRTRSGTIQPLTVPKRQPDDRLLVTNYNMRPTSASFRSLIRPSSWTSSPVPLTSSNTAGPVVTTAVSGSTSAQLDCATSPAGPPTFS